MSYLKSSDRSILEKLFNMRSGLVLSFTDRQMGQFLKDEFKIDMYDVKYDFDFPSKSKVNRMRGIWMSENDTTVGGIILALTEQVENELSTNDKEISSAEKELIAKAREIGTRMLFPSFLENLQQPAVQELKLKADLIKSFNLSKIDDLPTNVKIYLLKVFYSYYENVLVAYYGSGLHLPTFGIDDLNDYFKILRHKIIKLIESDDTFSEIKDSKAYQSIVEPIMSLYSSMDFFDGMWEDFLLPQIINLREEIANKDLFENGSEIHKTDVGVALFLEVVSGEIEKLNRFQKQQEKQFYHTEGPQYKKDFEGIFGSDKDQPIKHEHTHRFENSIQEKDVTLNVNNVDENVVRKSNGKNVTLPKFSRAEWIRVSITFLDETNILLSDGKSIKPSSFDGMGCEDGRNGRSDENWAFLLKLARGNGQTSPIGKKERESVKKQKQKITDILRKIFQNDTDPFETEAGGIYKAKFEIKYREDDIPQTSANNRYSDVAAVFSEMTAPPEENTDK